MPHFDKALTILRDRATDLFGMGRSFERLMRTALTKEPGILGDRFERVWLWGEWPDRDGPDMGIDLVAEEREGGYCAIQCKFFDAHRPVPKKAIDSFMAASEPLQFTSRLIVNTGGPIQGNTLRQLEASPKPCRVLGAAELDRWDVDWLRFVDDPEALEFAQREPHTPHPYQQEAVDRVCAGLADHDRGQLILPCGTGKTAVTLWIAERMVGLGGRVLYLVPSIALMAQTMREWSAQKTLPLRYVGICSDTRAGRDDDEDASLLELDYPVTTDPEKIEAGLAKARPEALTVVFCTYQSLPLVVNAQANGAPTFDLVVCDEAHRTTGVEDAGGNRKDNRDVSPFRLVHDAARLRVRKRLYATATPRGLYIGGPKPGPRPNRGAGSLFDGRRECLRACLPPHAVLRSHRGRLSDRLQGCHPDAEIHTGGSRVGQPDGACAGVGACPRRCGQAAGLLGCAGRSGRLSVRPGCDWRPAQPVAAGHYLHEHDPEVAIGRDPLAGRSRRRARQHARD